MQDWQTTQKQDVWVTTTPDCGENTGGFYCQVYADEDWTEQIDDFCIHPEELSENPNLDYWIDTACQAYRVHR